MTRRIYTLTLEPRGDMYRLLLEVALSMVTVAGVVSRPGMRMAASADDALSRLAAFRIDESEGLEWPGTRLLGKPARIYRHRYCLELVEVLCELATGLYDWCAPALPEDLFLVRSDDSEWLATISHEADSYLKLDDTEFEAIVEKMPNLGGRLVLG